MSLTRTGKQNERCAGAAITTKVRAQLTPAPAAIFKHFFNFFSPELLAYFFMAQAVEPSDARMYKILCCRPMTGRRISRGQDNEVRSCLELKGSGQVWESTWMVKSSYNHVDMTVCLFYYKEVHISDLLLLSGIVRFFMGAFIFIEYQ